MNKELKDKYEKLGWKFEDNYFKSPRMKELMWLPRPNSETEQDLLTVERNYLLDSMETVLDDQFDKVCEGLINQQKLLMERGFPPEKIIKVSFDVVFDETKK